MCCSWVSLVASPLEKASLFSKCTKTDHDNNKDARRKMRVICVVNSTSTSVSNPSIKIWKTHMMETFMDILMCGGGGSKYKPNMLGFGG